MIVHIYISIFTCYCALLFYVFYFDNGCELEYIKNGAGTLKICHTSHTIRTPLEKEVADLLKWQYTSTIIMISGLTPAYGIQI